MNNFITASHAQGKGKEPDAVFAVLKRAKDAIAVLGKDKVINAVIGSIYDDEGRFVTLPSVNEYFRQIPAEEMMDYAPIAGLPDFLEAAIDYTFQDSKPENVFIKAVSTPGGTGAIRHSFFNYAEFGQKVLIPDWFWGPYRTIAEEHGIKVDTYVMFDKEYNFTLSSIKHKSEELLKVQDRLVIIFNTPGHNPTGYSMTEKDWLEVLKFYKECAKNKQKKIVLVLDIAYIDYVGKPSETRKFMKLLGGLPENILIIIAFSMSKSFTMYGMRSGALIGLSSSQEEAEEFSRINSYSSRGVWSNGTRGAQRLLTEVMKDPALRAKIDAERKKYRELIYRRADIFLKEAREIGLVTLPYHGGFFITVPAKDPKAAAEKLALDNIYVVPLKMGLRLAVCALPTYQIPGLAAKIKAVL